MIFSVDKAYNAVTHCNDNRSCYLDFQCPDAVSIVLCPVVFGFQEDGRAKSAL